jgi:16S rRNA (guanine966-N2)-methyltransferase
LTERVKGALFATLEGEALGPWPTPFLDLFAGSGAGGIEALSRGAARAVLVERDRAAAAIIRTNLQRTGFDAATRASTIVADVPTYLDAGRPALEPAFGAVLLDPPYGAATLLAALERLGERDRGWLAGEAVVVAKHFWRDAPPERIVDLGLVRQRRFGETSLSFYRLVAGPEEADPA